MTIVLPQRYRYSQTQLSQYEANLRTAFVILSCREESAKCFE